VADFVIGLELCSILRFRRERTPHGLSPLAGHTSKNLPRETLAVKTKLGGPLISETALLVLCRRFIRRTIAHWKPQRLAIMKNDKALERQDATPAAVQYDNPWLGGELVPVAPEQAAIRRMIKLRANGASLREIAAAMKHDGFNLSHYGVDQVIKAASARQQKPRAA
jgi:hypothetical protein